jgi:uncharacterized membrane protein YagU involved in acid resistance
MNSTDKAMEEVRTETPFLHGILGGIIAGFIFILAQMILNLAMGEPFFEPLRLVSRLVLGSQALDPAYSLVTAAITGLIAHLTLSAFYGIIFVYLLNLTRQLRASTGRIVVYGALYGLVLWAINFQVIAPLVFHRFTEISQFWNGFVAHTFFYGTILGAYAAETRPGMTIGP